LNRRIASHDRPFTRERRGKSWQNDLKGGQERAKAPAESQCRLSVPARPPVPSAGPSHGMTGPLSKTGSREAEGHYTKGVPRKGYRKKGNSFRYLRVYSMPSRAYEPCSRQPLLASEAVAQD
jgi:hypothetical protein